MLIYCKDSEISQGQLRRQGGRQDRDRPGYPYPGRRGPAGGRNRPQGRRRRYV